MAVLNEYQESIRCFNITRKYFPERYPLAQQWSRLSDETLKHGERSKGTIGPYDRLIAAKNMRHIIQLN